MQRRRPAANKVKKQYQDVVDRIEVVGPELQTFMGLDHIEIEHHYLDAGSELIFGESRPKDRPGAVRCDFGSTKSGFTACVETRWNYQMADVYFILPSCVLHDVDRMEHIVCHEYSHILAAPEQYLLELKLAELAADTEFTATDFDIAATMYYERMEMATENITRAIWPGFEIARLTAA